MYVPNCLCYSVLILDYFIQYLFGEYLTCLQLASRPDIGMSLTVSSKVMFVSLCARHLLAFRDWRARYTTSCWGSTWRSRSSYSQNGRLSSYSSCFHATFHLLILVLWLIVSPLLEVMIRLVITRTGQTSHNLTDKQCRTTHKIDGCEWKAV
jgi:hypothetical protein